MEVHCATISIRREFDCTCFCSETGMCFKQTNICFLSSQSFGAASHIKAANISRPLYCRKSLRQASFSVLIRRLRSCSRVYLVRHS
ncbi:unnamed protein product [Schistosoma mattheei]|uniref:Uncharacterized protein n=1 Tax=Schistosoma mattheei TaxID=31246 RepID=A0A3P7XSL4_9TREM|nr:unnamed protein product [Schistosoma mattheei]